MLSVWRRRAILELMCEGGVGLARLRLKGLGEGVLGAAESRRWRFAASAAVGFMRLGDGPRVAELLPPR